VTLNAYDILSTAHIRHPSPPALSPPSSLNTTLPQQQQQQQRWLRCNAHTSDDAKK
jgi:hypothetical protein